MKFIDDTYNTYHLALFGSDKAWHVTTRLASKLIQIIAQPSIGMEISFKSHHKNQIGNIIFYTALRSLDQMMSIRRYRFKHHPEVTSELSQYLAMNTDFEATKILKESVDGFTELAKKLKTEATSNVSSANAANDMYDSKVKPKLANLETRIQALEKKK